jgi:hypothetical protein
MIGNIKRLSWRGTAVAQAAAASSIAPSTQSATVLALRRPAAESSWDPYEVWLNRVQRPRIERAAKRRTRIR